MSASHHRPIATLRRLPRMMMVGLDRQGAVADRQSDECGGRSPAGGVGLDVGAGQPVAAVLPAEVVDGIAERIVLAAEPADRAAVINGLVAEVYATVGWRQGAGEDDAELVSLRRLVAEAQAHQGRMAAAGQVAGR